MTLAWLDTDELDSSYEELLPDNEPDGECIWIDEWVGRSASPRHLLLLQRHGLEEDLSRYTYRLQDKTSSDYKNLVEHLKAILARLEENPLQSMPDDDALAALKLSMEETSAMLNETIVTLRRSAVRAEQVATTSRGHERHPEIDWRRINREALARSGTGINRFDEDGVLLVPTKNLKIEEGVLEADDPED